MLKKAFAGKVFLVGDHVNTDILHPPDYFSLKRDKVAAGLSKGCKEDFMTQLGPDSILVAGRNFGCGSSRESSARSFKYNGIEIIIAESFARIFYRNLTNQGIHLITCPGIARIAAQGEAILGDLEKSEIKNMDSSWQLACDPVPDYVRKILAHGGLVNFLKAELKKNNQFLLRSK